MRILLKYPLFFYFILSVITQGSTTFENCSFLSSVICHTTRLSYGSSFFSPRSHFMNEQDARKRLDSWVVLKVFPQCWNIAEPFLCSTHLPRCHNNTVYQPCKHLCTRTGASCGEAVKFSSENSPFWMNCESYDSLNCNQNITVPLFNGSLCSEPFVATDHQINWYDGIKGCGLSCKKTFVTEKKVVAVRRFVVFFGLLSFLTTLGSVSTFLIDWKTQNRYPAVIIFYMNSCFCICSCGWLVQFLGNTRGKIICRDDGTLRTGEPISESGSGWCLLTFIMVYSFSMSAVMWFLMLAYSWHLSFKSLGTKRDPLSGKTGYFHFLAWIAPVLLTVTVLVMEKVDASNIFGICFVAYEDSRMREMFVFIPTTGSCLIGNIYLSLGLKSLYRVWKENPTFMNGKAAFKIKATMARIAIFGSTSILFVGISIACHVYEVSNKQLWETSRRHFLRCLIRNIVTGTKTKCTLEHEPSIELRQIQSFAVFGAAIAASSWTWTKATLKTWKRAWIRFRGFDVKRKLQLSLQHRRDKRRVVPLVRQSVPSAAILLPASQVHRRVSVSSVRSFQSHSSLPMRMASFISGITNDFNSTLKSKIMGEKVACRVKGEPFTPVVIRPREGRRGTLLSVESILTTSSNGARIMRRGSQQLSLTSASEYNRAFGHIYPAKRQIHGVQCPVSNDAGFASSNLRVIRMGEDKLETYIPGMCQRNVSGESDISNSEERDSYISPDETLKIYRSSSKLESI